MDQDDPVTVVVRHTARRDRQAEFEEWLRGISAAALPFDGHLGFHVVRPTDPARPEYLVMMRFATLTALQAWEASDTRREWLDRADPLITGPPDRERHTGMEVWFTPPAGRPPPPRYRMVAVTLLAVYPLISVVQATLTPALGDLPVLVRTLATSAFLVCVMTYGVMPVMTRLFARWLYGPAGG